MGIDFAIVAKVALYFCVGLLGVVSHFFKQKIKGQTPHDIRNWFVSHFKDTILSFIAFIVAFVWLWTSGDVTFMSAFMSGYMADSLFSRIEKRDVI